MPYSWYVWISITDLGLRLTGVRIGVANTAINIANVGRPLANPLALHEPVWYISDHYKGTNYQLGCALNHERRFISINLTL